MLHHYLIHKVTISLHCMHTYSSPSQANPSFSIVARRQYHIVRAPVALYCCLSTTSSRETAVNTASSSHQHKSLFLFCTFDSSPSDTLQHFTQTDTHSSAGRLLTLPTDSSTTIHRSTHNNSHQHAFSSRPRRSHHGAVRPTRFNTLSCLCCSHFSCSSSGIFFLLDGDH